MNLCYFRICDSYK